MWTMSSTASTGPSPRASRRNRRLAAALGVLAVVASSGGTLPALAQQIVFDPRAHVQTSLQAARQLESLANQARQLANEARGLAASPYSHLAESSRTLRDIGELARTVRGAAATLEGVQRQFADLYPDDLSHADLAALGGRHSAVARRTAEDVARTAAELERLAQGRDQRLRGALAASESAYRVEACSAAGACGLTQLMPGTAADLGVTDRFNIEQNLSGGADYLARQLLRFGDLRLALAAYNAGPGRVARLGRIPEIAETQAYVVSVIDCYLALTAGRSARSARECRAREPVS